MAGVFIIDILQKDEDMAFLNRSVDIRHDLVHRNGRKSRNCNTDEVHNITVDMINELITYVDRLVNDIEQPKEDV